MMCWARPVKRSDVGHLGGSSHCICGRCMGERKNLGLGLGYGGWLFIYLQRRSCLSVAGYLLHIPAHPTTPVVLLAFFI